MTDYVAFVAQTVLVDVVDIPPVLPLAELDGELEAPTERRKVHTARECGVAQAHVAVLRRVLARELQVNHKRHLAGHQEARRDRRGLIAEVARRARIVLLVRTKERVEKIAERILARAAAVLHDAVEADGPAGYRLERQGHARQAGSAGRGGAVR